MAAGDSHRLNPQRPRLRRAQQRITQAIKRLLTAAQLGQQAGHRGVRLQQFGLGSHGVAIGGQRLIEPTRIGQQMAAHGGCFGQLQAFRPGPLNLSKRSIRLTALAQFHRQIVARDPVGRVGRKLLLQSRHLRR